MFLLIEIRDGTNPKLISESTFIDLRSFERLEDAIIYAEPHHMEESEEGSNVVVSEEGEFGIVPIAKSKHLPELVRKWRDPELARFYFSRYKSQEY